MINLPRKRGRPRKNPIVEEVKEPDWIIKRKRGRPRKIEGTMTPQLERVNNAPSNNRSMARRTS